MRAERVLVVATTMLCSVVFPVICPVTAKLQPGSGQCFCPFAAPSPRGSTWDCCDQRRRNGIGVNDDKGDGGDVEGRQSFFSDRHRDGAWYQVQPSVSAPWRCCPRGKQASIKLLLVRSALLKKRNIGVNDDGADVKGDDGADVVQAVFFQ